MNVAVVADSDWLVIVLVDAVESIDWLCGGKEAAGSVES